MARKNKYTVIDSEMDYTTSVRTFTGRLTRKRYKIIDRYCRSHYYRQHCGHDHDCCGCVFMEKYWFEYKHNQVRVYFLQHRNY